MHATLPYATVVRHGTDLAGLRMHPTVPSPAPALRTLVAAALCALTVQACSVYVSVQAGDNGSIAPSATPATCPTGLLEENGVQVCVQGPLPRQAGNLLVVTFFNQRTDAAALVIPTYTFTASDGSSITDTTTSMADAESGLLTLPGGGWTIDYRFVPAGVAKVTVTPAVEWLKGKATFPGYTKLQFHSTCYQAQPFAGCQWINHNVYTIRVRSEIDLIATKSDGTWTLEKIIADGPGIDLVPGSDTLVPATAQQVAAISDWLAADSSNRFQQQIETTPDQPDFQSQ